jgi:hypothetical protein
MDMKKILQAMDSVNTSAPIENTDDMKQFMSIVTEGSNPHKVALPVQMAMQHYSKPVEDELIKQQFRPSLLKQYMAEASAEQELVQYSKAADLKMYAQKIAYKVMRESSDLRIGPPEPKDNPKDIVKLDIPLLIRLFEYSREDAKTDMDLHNVTTRLIELSGDGDVLTMDHYDQIVINQRTDDEF